MEDNNNNNSSNNNSIINTNNNYNNQYSKEFNTITCNNDNSLNEYQNLYCLNCGKKGHVHKKCLQPIISLGIICIKMNINLDMNDIINYSKKIQNNYLFSLDEINKLKKIKYIICNLDLNNFDNIIEYLFIRRKNSLNYVEFMRGKYDLDNITYLENILNLISIEEKELLLNNDFENLWSTLWEFNKKNNTNNSEFKNSEQKFNLIKKGFITKKNEINIYTSLSNIFNNSVFHYKEPEWGFPKGRKNPYESDLLCAYREYEEETGYHRKDLQLIKNIVPYEEIFIGSNYKCYKHKYFVAKSNQSLPHSPFQESEVSDLKWFTYEEALHAIRPYNVERKQILTMVHSMLEEYDVLS